MCQVRVDLTIDDPASWESCKATKKEDDHAATVASDHDYPTPDIRPGENALKKLLASDVCESCLNKCLLVCEVSRAENFTRTIGGGGPDHQVHSCRRER